MTKQGATRLPGRPSYSPVSENMPMSANWMRPQSKAWSRRDGPAVAAAGRPDPGPGAALPGDAVMAKDVAGAGVAYWACATGMPR